ncbi:hypothetical protein DFH78_003678 [Clostridium beijerinckii]|nr:hypothetical protein [Clostridium beijerinckii]
MNDNSEIKEFPKEFLWEELQQRISVKADT